jgi:hypothetical protein
MLLLPQTISTSSLLGLMRPIEMCVFYTSYFKTNILLCLDFSYLALVTVATAEAEKLGCSYVILTSEGPVCGGWGDG